MSSFSLNDNHRSNHRIDKLQIIAEFYNNSSLLSISLKFLVFWIIIVSFQANGIIDASVPSTERVPMQYMGLLLGSKKPGGKSGELYGCDLRNHHHDGRIVFGKATINTLSKFKPWKGYLLWRGDMDTSPPVYLSNEMDVSAVGVIPTAYEFWIINYIKEIASKVQGKTSVPESWQAHHRPKVSLYHLFLELMDFVKLRE